MSMSWSRPNSQVNRESLLPDRSIIEKMEAQKFLRSTANATRSPGPAITEPFLGNNRFMAPSRASFSGHSLPASIQAMGEGTSNITNGSVHGKPIASPLHPHYSKQSHLVYTPPPTTTTSDQQENNDPAIVLSAGGGGIDLMDMVPKSHDLVDSITTTMDVRPISISTYSTAAAGTSGEGRRRTESQAKAKILNSIGRDSNSSSRAPSEDYRGTLSREVDMRVIELVYFDDTFYFYG